MRCLFIVYLFLACADFTLAQGSKVSFRDDHVVLVDGKPFFPLGLYYCNEEFDAPQDEKAALGRSAAFEGQAQGR